MTQSWHILEGWEVEKENAILRYLKPNFLQLSWNAAFHINFRNAIPSLLIVKELQKQPCRRLNLGILFTILRWRPARPWWFSVRQNLGTCWKDPLETYPSLVWNSPFRTQIWVRKHWLCRDVYLVQWIGSRFWNNVTSINTLKIILMSMKIHEYPIPTDGLWFVWPPRPLPGAPQRFSEERSRVKKFRTLHSWDIRILWYRYVRCTCYSV